MGFAAAPNCGVSRALASVAATAAAALCLQDPGREIGEETRDEKCGEVRRSMAELPGQATAEQERYSRTGAGGVAASGAGSGA